ncbi:MAG: hypothetical protein M3O74_05630 [Pseudomonadota bacterium]|nr:hypothetical protein [Pseudomonadota bacterium]
MSEQNHHVPLHSIAEAAKYLSQELGEEYTVKNVLMLFVEGSLLPYWQLIGATLEYANPSQEVDFPQASRQGFLSHGYHNFARATEYAENTYHKVDGLFRVDIDCTPNARNWIRKLAGAAWEVELTDPYREGGTILYDYADRMNLLLAYQTSGPDEYCPVYHFPTFDQVVVPRFELDRFISNCRQHTLALPADKLNELPPEQASESVFEHLALLATVIGELNETYKQRSGLNIDSIADLAIEVVKAVAGTELNTAGLGKSTLRRNITRGLQTDRASKAGGQGLIDYASTGAQNMRAKEERTACKQLASLALAIAFIDRSYKKATKPSPSHIADLVSDMAHELDSMVAKKGADQSDLRINVIHGFDLLNK